ncbi:HlyD family secretion protein [Tuwongella immobilis]|uniref:Multidrug resistance protein MdtA-like barrel-sandwich hybrid domain-containing protein n=1 Tax=Tuwongella immobilis TaxID=692036 RepID=A0A6C2YHL2_9BACT|nr:HlyD family efflux transporter periplasmic adaptor subunit [Tuwongella immobilis]VIP00623.1 Secretion protein HlyD OS=Rhodopirellula sp. SWK7 GN=RRSWK_03860 PE=4 SV=1: Biotin_lipoyl_2 [Tuwongella immobilis]VTR96664.1 Secretion protein HlyD OS=Rhodopirellula sp. SWK7 GN=RRSWK_03860 PE=4 SV=1: Biotin_lipoyl_2 [Tuwongella immobilis]
MNAPLQVSTPSVVNPTILPAMSEVRTPRIARITGRLLIAFFLITPIILIFVPWVQTIQARGRVIAWLPTEREQPVTARVSGQIRKWHVTETDRVNAGDPIVDIDDTDVELGSRLAAQREFLLNRKLAVTKQLEEQSDVAASQTSARDAAVRAAQASMQASEQSVLTTKASLRAAEAVVAYESVRYKTFDELLKNPKGGLESELNVRSAFATLRRAEEDVARLTEEVKRAEAGVKQAYAAFRKAEADGAASIATANANLARTEQDLNAIERELQDIENRIERYKARLLTAPCDGTVLRIEPDASQVGQYVKEGQVVCVIVPDTATPVVELFVSGVDAPLVPPESSTDDWPHVRLQFEGWPAVQFSGYPQMSIGTFGGRVFRMDPTNVQNQFRILVKPDQLYERDDWPDSMFLRQGNAAMGYIQLRSVPLGWELWRRMNGFPAMTPPKEYNKSEKVKPPKLKV